MTRPEQQKESRSLRLYARLLELYPSAFLQRHRAEMLQNFADLEDAAASKTALWLLIGKDLTMTLISHFFASRLGIYVIGVFVAWILFFAIGYFRYGTHARPSGFACLRRLSARHAVHVCRDTSLRNAAKQLVRDRYPCRVRY